jgi:hypothetical protein
MVTGRWYVAEVTRFAYNPAQRTVKLRASTKGDENKAWAAATPSGEITMQISNEAAAKWFEDRLGQDVSSAFDDIEQL